jgi:hypothetical protein
MDSRRVLEKTRMFYTLQPTPALHDFRRLADESLQRQQHNG